MLKMNSKVYKWCAVPLCKNTSIATPNKLFVYVPNKKIVRDKWLTLARRDPAGVVTNSSIYFCEDHFDLPNDMENYMQYNVMGSVSQVRMKPGCLPRKFACQPDRKTRTSDTVEQPYICKKRKIEEFQEHLEENNTVTEIIWLQEHKIVPEYDIKEIASGSSVQHNLEEAQQGTLKMIDKCIQVHLTKIFKSKANQTEVSLVNQETSHLKPHLHSLATSPFKMNHCVNCNPSSPSVSVLRKKIKKRTIDSDTSSSAGRRPLLNIGLPLIP